MTWLRDIDRWFIEDVLPLRPNHLRYARRLSGSPDEAEDLLQDVYVRLFGLGDCRHINNANAFVLRMIHNVAVDRCRKASVVQINQALRLDLFDPADEAPSPEREVLARDELRQVSHAMALLPDRCQEALRLRRVEGFSPSGVAEKMAISVSTVEKHLAKAMQLLTQKLRAGEQMQELEHSAHDARAAISKRDSDRRSR
jgi:RNA polymerase sigma-70 factor (ECF subfamily)